jgi:hypothetical protein
MRGGQGDIVPPRRRWLAATVISFRTLSPAMHLSMPVGIFPDGARPRRLTAQFPDLPA